mgnify:CR=1 FL=1
MNRAGGLDVVCGGEREVGGVAHLVGLGLWLGSELGLGFKLRLLE